MKSKRHHHHLHLRPPHLLTCPRVQTQQITPPLRPIQYHAQTHRVVLFFALRIANEHRLARRLRVIDARDGRLRFRVVFEQAVEES